MAATAPTLRKALQGRSPSLTFERALWDAGHGVVVGMDEVGRGAWAGPLTVGAAVLPRDRRVYKIRDSKQLTEHEREALFDRIAGWCTWAVGHASHEECDELGMSEAQRLAARRALAGLGLRPDRVLLDGKWDFVGGGIAHRLVRGDARCLSIAAASILAKVTRDRIMRAEAEHYTSWWFDANKGYPCPRHKAVLRGMGPSAIHRRSWVFMDSLVWTGVPRIVRPDPQGSLFPLAPGVSGARPGWPWRQPGTPATVADTPESHHPDLDEMAERLDEVGAKIDEARRQAEADDLLADEEGKHEGDPFFEEVGLGLGDVDEETPTEGSGSA